MHKTAIFIIQLCVFVKLFAIKVVKFHFCHDFVMSGWVKETIDFHWMKCTIHYGVVRGKSRQSGTID